jgi:hypothetical protein
MDPIEPEALYDERREVSWTRPFLQGDVFDDVVLPGFGDEPMKVQIVAHPCAMRTGPNFTARITVAPVVGHQRVTGSGWNRYLRLMPLAELAGDQHFATKFVDVTAAPAQLLTHERRIATLSNRGIYVLQQRLVKHYTRVEMPLELLRRESAAVLAEAELQRDWLDEVLTEAEQTDMPAIEAETAVFDDWLGERLDADAPSRRELLREDIHHADVRRQTQRAASARAQQRGDDR